MDVILLERVPKLGQMGDVVAVKNGYARNFLLPQKKALRASQENRKYFETERATIEAQNIERRTEAESVGERLSGRSFVIIRSASDTGSLYGSVSTRDIAECASEEGVSIQRNQIEMSQPIKTLGMHEVNVTLHPEVVVTITANVARSMDEARQLEEGTESEVQEEGEGAEGSSSELPEESEESAGDENRSSAG